MHPYHGDGYTSSVVKVEDGGGGADQIKAQVKLQALEVILSLVPNRASDCSRNH